MDPGRETGSVQILSVVIRISLGGNSATGVTKLSHKVLEVEQGEAVVVVATVSVIENKNLNSY